MPINDGWIRMSVSTGNGAQITVKIRYDQTHSRPGQPLINDATEGACVVVQNDSTGTAPLVVTSGTQGTQTFNLAPGRTTVSAAQMAARGIATREQADGLSLSSP